MEEQNVRQIQSSHSAKNDIKQSIKSYDSQRRFHEDTKFGKHSTAQINTSSNNSSRKRNSLKQKLQKQSASKLQRYLSIKKSIKWYVPYFSCFLDKANRKNLNHLDEINKKNISKNRLEDTPTIYINILFYFDYLNVEDAQWDSR